MLGLPREARGSRANGCHPEMNNKRIYYAPIIAKICDEIVQRRNVFNVRAKDRTKCSVGMSKPRDFVWSIFTPVSHLDVLRRFPSNSLPFIHSRLLLEQYWTLYNWIFCPIMSRAKVIFHRKILLFFETNLISETTISMDCRANVRSKNFLI